MHAAGGRRIGDERLGCGMRQPVDGSQVRGDGDAGVNQLDVVAYPGLGLGQIVTISREPQ